MKASISFIFSFLFFPETFYRFPLGAKLFVAAWNEEDIWIAWNEEDTDGLRFEQL